MSESTPNYIVSEDAHYMYSGSGASGIVAKGSFVRPIEFRHLPKRIRDDRNYNYSYDSQRDAFVYASCGIVLILRELIEKL